MFQKQKISKKVAKKKEESRNVHWVDTVWLYGKNSFIVVMEPEITLGQVVEWGREEMEAVNIAQSTKKCGQVITENERDKSWEDAWQKRESLAEPLRVMQKRADLEQVKKYNKLGRQISINLQWHQCALVGNSF